MVKMAATREKWKMIEKTAAIYDKTMTIIPQQNHGLIAEVIAGIVKVVGEFDIPYNSISKIIDNETIATLDKSNRKLLIHTIDGVLLKSISVPFGLAMNVKNHTVYIGGNANDGEVCYRVDLDSKDLLLQNINLPIPMGWGKAVDDILILDNKMLLIDNIVFPKFTFEYDISTPDKPFWVGTTKLPEERPYEHIIKGDMNENWMIYLSTSSSGWSGDEAHITIEGKYSNTISSSKKESIVDICLIDDALFALTDIGLGVFDLAKERLNVGDIAFIEHEIVADKIIKINSTMLLLVSKYTYELIDLDNLRYLDESIEERFWSYGSLDLSNRDLTSFPTKKIRHLERVEHLDLSNNRDIKEFPEALRRCTQLRSLNLKFTGITKIPDWIEEFEKLEYLNISTINIDNAMPLMASRIKLPKNLKILNLRYCQISAIPPSVFALKELEYLNLLENNISKIPDGITALQKLKTLKIRWENISKFPDDINTLPLETVEISARRGKIPDVIYAMTNLKRIEAGSAGIRSISTKIANFSRLEYLDLKNNYDLEKLPENIGELKNLKRLGLSVCGLKELPESFCDLAELEVLHLQHNKLTKLPDSIGKLRKLRKLDLDANQLTALPESFKHLTSLKSLLLSRNKLKTLPDGIKKLQNIKEAELWDNRFEEFPKTLCDLKQLTILNMWDNKIEVIPSEIQNLVNLTQLNMAKNRLVTLPEEMGALSRLAELSLHKNNLKALPSSVGRLKTLIDLSLSDNALTELPQELFALATLEKLDVKNNELEELPEQISQLENLKKLEISGNKFTTLPESIVNLRENDLSVLPEEIVDLVHLDFINLSRNQNLKLTKKQKKWLRTLKENGATVWVDDDILD